MALPASADASLDWEGLSAKLPTGKDAAASKTRKELWHRSDPNQNGYLSLAEIDEMIGAHLRAVVGTHKFSAPWWNRQLARNGAPPKKPDMRMALAATLRCSDVQPSVPTAELGLMSPLELRVERSQFRTLLIALRESIKKALDITEDALVDAVKKALEDEAKPPEPPQLLSPRTQVPLITSDGL